MEKNKDQDIAILRRVLTEEEFEYLKNAYGLYKKVSNQDLQILLLRRIDDVISMARFTDMSGAVNMHRNYESLSARLVNLKIAVENILHPEKQRSTFNYLADKTKTPYILRSIEYLDNQTHDEVGFLLEELAKGTGTEETITGELKRIPGFGYNLVFMRQGDSILVYDIENSSRPALDERGYQALNERMKQQMNVKPNSTVQRIYDEMVYQTVNFNVPTMNVGYRLIKKREEER